MMHIKSSENKLILKESDYFKLLLITVVVFLMLSAFLTYSVNKFNAVYNLSVVKNKVLMRVIHHNVKSVCPKCGFKGIPMCPTCSVEMYWNGYRGTFVCPSCGEGGFPKCRHCGEFMTWIEAK